MAVLEKYESNIGLKYYRMVPIAKKIWKLVRDMQNQIVARYALLGLDPVIDARRGGKTVHMRAKLRLPISSEFIEIFVRTTPSAAEAHMKTNRKPTNKFAAISWSAEFEKDSIERRVVNERQVQIRSSASLNATLV